MSGAELLPGALLGATIGVAHTAHCAGMCGVFALRAGSREGRGVAARMALYLSGKAFTYVFLGTLAGLAGASLLDTVSFGGTQVVLGVAVGLVLVVAGWRLVRPPRGVPGSSFLARALAPMFRWAHDAEKQGGAFGLGLATGFLPCGAVYYAAIQGTALGTPLRGAALMAGFGLGTAPVLLAIGLLGGGAVARLGPTRLRVAGGLLMLSAGIVGIVRALLPLMADGSGGGAVCCN